MDPRLLLVLSKALAALKPSLIAFRDLAAPLALCLPDARPEPIAVPSAECPG